MGEWSGLFFDFSGKRISFFELEFINERARKLKKKKRTNKCI